MANCMSPLSKPRKLVRLREILSKEYTRRQDQDYIEVNVVHSFLLKKSNHVECHFIFADDEDHISGVLYYNNPAAGVDQVPPHVYSRLKEGTKHRIKYFEVMLAGHRLSGGNMRSKFLLRDQMKRLKLRNGMHDIEEIDDHGRTFLDHMPFQFTGLDNIVENEHQGKLIDVIAYIKDVEQRVTPYGEQFQLVKLVGRSPNLLESQTSEKHLHVPVFGRFMKETFSYGSLYALANMLVKEVTKCSVCLFTTWGSVIMEVSKENIRKVFSPCEDTTEIRNVLETGCICERLDTRNDSDDDSGFNDDDHEDEFLARIFSQILKVIPESTTLEVVTPPRSQPPQRNQETELLTVVVPSASSDSPSKRTKATELVSSSPAKKSRHSPPHHYSDEDRPQQTIMDTVPSSYNLLQTSHQFYDCIHQIWPYNVIVTLSNQYKDIKPDAYFMRSKRRGMALIINNYFLGITSKERQGSCFDVMYLTEFLRKCGFDVTTKRDLTSVDLKPTIKEFKQKMLSVGTDKFDALFIAVMSHGVSGAIEMADEVHVPLYDDIIHQFDEHNFQPLEGKPKIFVVQACQDFPTVNDVKSNRHVMTQPQGTKMKNIIVCHGACPGSKAYRDRYLGSHFIYVLVDILMKNSHNHHFEKMLKLVQKALENVRWEQEAELTCSWNSFMFKKLYFNPGL